MALALPDPPTPHETRLSTRAAKLAGRNQKIRDLFYERYTKQPRVNGAKIYTREGVIAKLAEEFYLSMGRIENILYQ